MTQTHTRKRGGLWRDPNVPKTGWQCFKMEDAGEVDFICEMCGEAAIRYRHYMVHPTYKRHAFLIAGCICAGKMEGDGSRAADRERRFRNHQARRARWLHRKDWRKSKAGNQYINVDGYNIVVFPKRGEDWGWHTRVKKKGKGNFYITHEGKVRIAYEHPERGVAILGPFSENIEAALAALDAMLEDQEAMIQRNAVLDAELKGAWWNRRRAEAHVKEPAA